MGELKVDSAAGALLARHGAPRLAAAWAESARHAARERVLALGAAGRRDEYWRFTNPAALNAADAPDVEILELDETPVFDAADKLVCGFEITAILDFKYLLIELGVTRPQNIQARCC